MKLTNEKILEIKNFICDNLEKHPNDIVKFCATNLGHTNVTIRSYLQQLIDEDIIIKTGDKKHVLYTLKSNKFEFDIDMDGTVEEDIVWNEYIEPKLIDIKDNIMSICLYSFTEMVNNVIDHSEATKLKVSIIQDAVNIKLMVSDNGVGIFDKIQKDLGLPYRQESIFQLQKGKFTSDPDNHTGEGIFFSSKMFDKFIISSKGLGFVCERADENDGWIFESSKEEKNDGGTIVFMQINKNSDITSSEVFNKFSDPDSTPGFFKTICTLNLLQYEGSELISRSQAKRLISRFDKFSEVVLDFANVENIGQGFADQLFRVFVNSHPETSLSPINMTDNVEIMVRRVQQQ